MRRACKARLTLGPVSVPVGGARRSPCGIRFRRIWRSSVCFRQARATSRNSWSLALPRQSFSNSSATTHVNPTPRWNENRAPLLSLTR